MFSSKMTLLLSVGITALSFGTISSASASNTLFMPTPSRHSAQLNILYVGEEQIGVGAQNFVQNMAERALSFLSDPNLQQDTKKQKFQKLLDSSFDMKTIGRFALGRYWRTSSAEEKKEYFKLFNEMVVEVYANRFGEYKGQLFEARSFRDAGKNDTIVNSHVISPDGSSNIEVDWRVRYKEGQYKIVDVIVEGVSMSVTQRSDFASVIQRGGGDIQVLLAHLRTQ